MLLAARAARADYVRGWPEHNGCRRRDQPTPGSTDPGDSGGAAVPSSSHRSHAASSPAGRSFGASSGIVGGRLAEGVRRRVLHVRARLNSLTGLRFVAALLVFANHVGDVVLPRCSSAGSTAPTKEQSDLSSSTTTSMSSRSASTDATHGPVGCCSTASCTRRSAPNPTPIEPSSGASRCVTPCRSPPASADGAGTRCSRHCNEADSPLPGNSATWRGKAGGPSEP